MGATMGKNGGNLLDSLPSTQGTMHIVMLGLDSAGKTTALYRLKFDQYLNTVPTIGFNCEKVRGTVGKAKGVQFLVWDVGGQEKLRPLWRSYTRCTDGIVFVVDSVDVERMEEAKMELMRTAKCPDNQGVPVLILANKQDLPGAREPKELEKLLGLHELSPIYPFPGFTQSMSLSSSSSVTSSQQHQIPDIGSGSQNQQSLILSPNTPTRTEFIPITTILSSSHQTNIARTPDSPVLLKTCGSSIQLMSSSNSMKNDLVMSTETTNITAATTQTKTDHHHHHHHNSSHSQHFKGWFIQPACAITGEGLQDGLDALYDMIIKKRKMNKTNKKKR